MAAARDTIAACVIARDEEERLPGALESVAFCDEVIVVDSGSRDRTVEIAQSAGARVVEHRWKGFGRQRNVAIDAATADWILELDADERLTPELANELQSFLCDPPKDVAIGVLPMREWFLGRLLGPSVKYPRYRTRLFRRGAYRHDEDRAVHEGIWPRGPTWAAKADMHHLLADSLREALGDMWRYARLEAEGLPRPSGPVAVLTAVVVRPAAKFAYRVVVDRGWRDGPRGLLKILLDCGADAVVGLRVLLRRGGGAPEPETTGAGVAVLASPRAPAPAGGGKCHYGRAQRRGGPVRIVALTAGEAETRRAREWLGRARDAGADVALVTDGQSEASGPLFTVRLERTGAFAALRALDAVEQARPFDALVVGGGRAGRVARRLPKARRGSAGLQSLDDEPGEVVAKVTALARPAGPEPAAGVER